MIRRTARILGVTLAGSAVVVTAAAGLFAWRLVQGPIALDPLTPYVETALSDPEGRFAVRVGELVLSLESEDALTGSGSYRLDLRARRVRAVNAEGTELGAVPEMGLGLSVAALFRGKLSPTRLELVRPRVQVLRRADGNLAFDVRTDATADSQPEDGRPDLFQELVASLRSPPDIDRPMGLLRRLTITGADLTVVNRMLDLSWHAQRADVVLVRDEQGTEGTARVTLDASQREGGRPVTVAATGRYHNADGGSDVALTFDGLAPAELASIGPALAPLAAVSVPLGGRLEARLDERFQPVRLGFDLQGGAGSVTLPPDLRPDPVAVAGLSARGSLDVAGRRAVIDALSLRVPASGGGEAVALSGHGALTQRRDGAHAASAVLSLTSGGHTAGFDLDGVRDAEGGGQGRLRVTGFQPSSVAALAPALAPLAAAELPLSGDVDLTVDPALRPTSVRGVLTAGPGRVLRPEMFDAPLPVASAELRLQGDRASGRLEVERLALALGDAASGPRVEGKATITERDGRAVAEASVTAHGMPMDDLHRYWPRTLGRNSRDWVTANISAGVVTEATAVASLSAPLDAMKAVKLDHFNARILGENASVRYFHDLTHVTGAGMEATTDGKTFAIQTRGGRIGDIELGDGKVLISGLDVGREAMDIRVPVRGPVRSILTLLDMPPLGYPTKLELDPKRSQGNAEAQLHFAFPLLLDLKVEDLNLDVAGRLRGVGVEKVAAGMNATDGDLSLALDLKGMTIKGATKLDGIPVTVDWRESFESTAKGPRTRIAVKGDVTAEDLRSHGIDLEDRVTGPMGADILFTVDRRHKLALGAVLNLEKTRLSIAELGWEKPPGQPGSGKLSLDFDKDRPTRVGGLTVEAGGLKAQADLELADGGRRVARVLVSMLKVGQTDLRADLLVRPKTASGLPGGYAGTITGASLDARHLVGKPEAAKAGDGRADPGDGRKTPLDLNLKLDAVVFGDGRRLRQIAGTMRRDPNAWTHLDVTGQSGPNGRVALHYLPGAGGFYDLLIQAEDMGAALKAMDLNDRMQGGRLRLTGRSAEPRADAAIAGRAEIFDYTLIDVPVLARLLNAISPSGFAELLGGGKGVNFGRMTADFRKEGRLLTLKDLRTSGSALGLTLEGEVDIDTETANLRGTIVPIYGLNRLIGQIPLLGDILSGGEGQGIFSATWRVRGPLSDPDVTVNPLAVLAPGFLRNLFFLGEGSSSTPPAESRPPPESHTR